jgi:hypothetical protein
MLEPQLLQHWAYKLLQLQQQLPQLLLPLQEELPLSLPEPKQPLLIQRLLVIKLI